MVADAPSTKQAAAPQEPAALATSSQNVGDVDSEVVGSRVGRNGNGVGMEATHDRAHERLMQQLIEGAQMDGHLLICVPQGEEAESCARYVHQSSHRAKGGFAQVNCRTVRSGGLEGALLGDGGTRTASQPPDGGPLAAAQNGTLFLDEVAALHPMDQLKLLRLMEAKAYRPPGDRRLQALNVRVVATTTTDVAKRIREGRLREDLLARLTQIG